MVVRGGKKPTGVQWMLPLELGRWYSSSLVTADYLFFSSALATSSSFMLLALLQVFLVASFSSLRWCPFVAHFISLPWPLNIKCSGTLGICLLPDWTGYGNTLWGTWCDNILVYGSSQQEHNQPRISLNAIVLPWPCTIQWPSYTRSCICGDLSNKMFHGHWPLLIPMMH